MYHILQPLITVSFRSSLLLSYCCTQFSPFHLIHSVHLSSKCLLHKKLYLYSYRRGEGEGELTKSIRICATFVLIQASRKFSAGCTLPAKHWLEKYSAFRLSFFFLHCELVNQVPIFICTFNVCSFVYLWSFRPLFPLCLSTVSPLDFVTLHLVPLYLYMGPWWALKMEPDGRV